MKIGISAFAWTSQFQLSHISLLPIMKSMGFDGVEIPMFHPAQLATREIRRTCEALSLECTICAILPPEINPISPDGNVRRKAIQHLKSCVESAAEAGAKLLGGPLYAPIGYLPEHRPTPEEWSWAVEAFQIAGSTLDAYQLDLSVEPVNRSETFFLRTAKEALALCEAIGHPRVGVTIDTFHANIEEKSIVEAVGSLGSRLMHIHASENDRSLLGTGHVDFPNILKALQTQDYNGYLMIEGFGYLPEERNAPGTLWADRSVSPELLAIQGRKYLSAMLEKAADPQLQR